MITRLEKILFLLIIIGLFFAIACNGDNDTSDNKSPSPTATHTLVPSPTLTNNASPSPTISPTIIPTYTVTPTDVPIPTRDPKNCPLDREDLKVALNGYYEQNNNWPTIDGQPGDIEWGKLVPAFLDGIPSTDGKCDWRINTEPPGELCLANYC